MGRVFLSPRMGVRAIAERWHRLGRAGRESDRAALDRLAGMAMAHASEAFYALDDPLEAVLVSVFTEAVRLPVIPIGNAPTVDEAPGQVSAGAGQTARGRRRIGDQVDRARPCPVSLPDQAADQGAVDRDRVGRAEPSWQQKHRMQSAVRNPAERRR